ncbi:ABC transporter ATP-binding protein [Streptomyces bacillaris]|uniref:ABC transporter ATP-binding protein n=1 Tax=Streptomyces bacillaris TaxID=68179 RepID=A0ABW6E334_9ACTN
MTPPEHSHAPTPPPTPPPTLGSVVAEHRRGLVVSALLSVLAAACSMAPYVAVYLTAAELFAPGPEGVDQGRIGWIAAFTALAVVLRSVLAGASSHLAHVTAYRILARLRLALADRLQRIPLGRVQRRSSGEMKKLLHDDVEQLEEALAHGVPDLAAAAAVPLTTTALLMAVDWRLGLVALGALVLLLAVSATGMALANKNNAALAAHSSVLNTAILTYLQGIKVIRGYLRHDSGYDQARAAVIKGAELNDRTLHSPVRWLVGVMTVATGFAVALLVPVAGHGFVDGRTGLDALALFLVVALGYLTPVIGLVGVLATVLVRIQFSATAVREMLAEEELPLPARPQAPHRFDVALEGVEFAYEAGREVLHGVSLDVPEGTTCALVGATGSGKTTIARLIARFWDTGGGRVAIGGVDVREIEPALLARLVAFVQQDEYVFATTLLENIRIARPGATDAEVIAAAEAAQLGELVAELPDGWATALGAGGGNLSGGQRQRISVARALLKDAPVVILDEATASLDALTERRTLQAVRALTRGRTVIAIAHRLDTVSSADRIAVVEDGRIRAAGSHDELLAADPGYRDLWTAYREATGWHLSGEGAGGPVAVSPAAPVRGSRVVGAPSPAGDGDDSSAPVGRADGTPSPAETADGTPDRARDADGWTRAAREVVRPGVGELGFLAQWRALLGRGRRDLLRRGLPRLLLEGTVRSVPLAAVFLLLDAAVRQQNAGPALTHGYVWGVTGFLAAGLVLRLIAVDRTNTVIWSIATRAKADLQLSVVERLRRVPLGFFSRVDNGRISTLVTNDTVMIDFQNLPQMLTGAFLQPVYVSVALLVIDWRLALAALVGMPVFFLLTAWSDRIYHRVFTDVHRTRAETSLILIEQARGAAALRAHPDSALAGRYRDAVERLRAASVRMSVRAAPVTALAAIAVELGLVVLIVVGAALYAAGSVSATVLLMFLLLSLVLYQPVQELTTLAGYRRNQEQIARKIGEVWDAPVLSEPVRPAEPADAELRFENVRFTYTGAESDLVLDGVDFTCRPGTITALVGASGSGKTTVANLAARLWDVDSGAVRIGGADLRELGSDRVMGLVTTVHQDVYLFDGTVRFNVTLGRPEASEEEVWAALAAAQCDDVVRALPGGLDHHLADGGSGLSGGQRQRLSIARALLKDSPVLILDEAVAAVDPQTEARIQEALARLVAGRTTVVIAHRLDTVREVDRIVVLAGGAVEAAGTHEELVTTSPTYRALLEAHGS